jgi:threonine dehydratase
MITPIETYPGLAKAIGVESIFFKREDLHPYGSHKGRSIPVMMDYYYEKGDRRFVITGSGNAALAAALHAQRINNNEEPPLLESKIDLDIFVGNHISPKKLQKIKDLEGDHVRILKKERPLQALNQSVQEGSRSLRQSTDDVALIGYKELADELSDLKKLGAIFIGTSSGTTAQALAQYYSEPKKKAQIHIVQTSACHPMSDAFETFDGSDEDSLADAIVDKTAVRKPELTRLVRETGGYGWVVSNDDIEYAQALVKKHTLLDISPNSALSVAGVLQAVYRGIELKGAVVCMICGD